MRSRKFCKPKNPWLVRMLLGDKINLVALRRDASQVGVVSWFAFQCSRACLPCVVQRTMAQTNQGVPVRIQSAWARAMCMLSRAYTRAITSTAISTIDVHSGTCLRPVALSPFFLTTPACTCNRHILPASRTASTTHLCHHNTACTTLPAQGIREEYHKFRDTSALVMLLGPLSLLAGMTWVDRSQGVPFGTGSLTPMLLTGGWGAARGGGGRGGVLERAQGCRAASTWVRRGLLPAGRVACGGQERPDLTVSLLARWTSVRLMRSY